MSSRYQTVFTILGDGNQGLALVDDVRDFVRNAIADQFGNPQAATADEGEWNNVNGHLEIDADRRDHSGFFTLSWKRPDDWELRWRLSTQGDAVEVDVQVVGPDGSGRTAGPPRLLTDILERYTCRLHGEDLPYEAVRISRENANWYANSVEEDRGGAEDTGSSERIAALEKGLASARAAIEKAEADRNTWRERLHQLQRRIDTFAPVYEGYRQKLEDQTSIIAGLRRDLVEAKNTAANLTSKLKEAEKLAPSDKKSGRQSKKIAQLEKKISQLGADATADQSEIRRLQSNNERLARRVTHVEPDRTLGEEAASDFAPADDDAQPKSVFEVVRQHQDLPNIRFLQSAFDSAESSPYQHLNLLDAALRAVSECGVARATGPLGMTVEQWFRQEPEGPIDYKPRESGQTNTRHPRIWEDDRCGQELNMQEHIALGGGGARDPKDVLRIHMAWCENERAWVIGHVGRHLDISTS